MTTDKTTERLRILAEAGTALFALAERQALLEQACDYTVQALGLEAMAILLVDRAQGVVRIVAQRNLPAALQEVGRALPLGKGMAGWVAASGEAQILEDAPADPRLAYLRDELIRANIHGLVSVPMRWADEVIGVVQGGVSRERAFGPEDVHTLTVLAGQIALALRNVERVEELRASEEQLKSYQAELEQKVRLLETQQVAIRELSTPVIQVWEGVLVLPLVGAVDSTRVRQIMESLLARIVETQSEIVLLDITGVPMVDTAVANHLLKTVQAARLLGARSIVTGLSPKVAQTVVELGVDLGDITTCANLRAGLEMALGMLGVTVK